MEHKERRGIFFPLLLIAVGGLLLLNTMGRLPGDIWGYAFKLWPLLLVVGGLDSLYRRENFVGPVVSIGIGAVLLLGNLGYIAPIGWQSFISLWPVLLIALGLDIMIGKRSAASAVIGIAVGVVLVGGVYLLAVRPPAVSMAPAEVQKIDQTLDKASEAQVKIEGVVRRIELADGAAPANLIEGNVALYRGERINDVYTVSDGKGVYSLKHVGTESFTAWPPSSVSAWELKLNESIPLDIETQNVIGEQTLDISGLKVSRLRAESVMGRTVLILPEEGDFDVNLEQVMGELVIQVPEGTALRITTDSVLAPQTLPEGYTRDNRVISSPEAETAANVIEIATDQVFGLLVVEYR